MDSASPLDDFRRLVRDLAPLAVPVEAGDRLAELAARLTAVQESRKATAPAATVLLFAGAHAVARHGVTASSATAIAAMLSGLAQGITPLNALCSSFGLGLKVLELAPDLPVGDIAEGAALDGRAAAATVAFGMEGGVSGVGDAVALAGIGAAGDVAAAALGAALRGEGASGWAEAQGLAQHFRLRRADVIGRALRLHGEAAGDPLEAMRRLGGREIAAIAGAIAAARVQKMLAVLDGEAAVAAALVLHALNADATSHCVLAHRLASPRMEAAAVEIGLEPLLDLGLRDGDGRAGAVAAGLVRAAAALSA